MENGCLAYCSTSKTNLKNFEVVKNTAIRMATGYLKSTSVDALRCETSLPPIKDIIEKQILEYFIRAGFLKLVNPIYCNNVLLKTPNL